MEVTTEADDDEDEAVEEEDKEEEEEDGEEEDDEELEGDADISKTTSKQARSKSSLSSASSRRGGRKRRRRRERLTVNLTTCKYASVQRATKRLNFRQTTDEYEWSLFWSDGAVSLERVMDMRGYQKVNHFPGMTEICRKDLLARNMNRLWKQFPKEYRIFPRTWCLPADFFDFQAFYRAKKNKVYILKPDSGAQGRGIFLTKNPKHDVHSGEDMTCQQYLTRPFLIDELKFDMRIYVLVASCDPLRLFVYNDGLARFATVKFAEPSTANCSNLYMHLTNYSIQKSSTEFVKNDEESGTKRRLSTMNKWFADHRVDVLSVWQDIDDVIIKTLISAHPILRHNYRTCFPNHTRGSACFEILGFDIILDRNLKPWVLEVNHSPSFTTDSQLDREIKDELIHDALVLVNFDAVDKRRCIEEERRRVRDRLTNRKSSASAAATTGDEVIGDSGTAPTNFDEKAQREYEDAHMGQFRRIYPENGNEENYEQFFENSCSLYQETAASKARTECARQQREEIQAKKEKLEVMRKLNCGGGKDATSDAVRPESAAKAQAAKTAMKNRQLIVKRLARENANAKPLQNENTNIPLPINEMEEEERLSGMVQREALLKALAIPQFVENALNGEMATHNTISRNSSAAAAGKRINISLASVGGKPAREAEPPLHPYKRGLPSMIMYGRNKPHHDINDAARNPQSTNAAHDHSQMNSYVYGGIFGAAPAASKSTAHWNASSQSTTSSFQPTGPGPPPAVTRQARAKQQKRIRLNSIAAATGAAATARLKPTLPQSRLPHRTSHASDIVAEEPPVPIHMSTAMVVADDGDAVADVAQRQRLLLVSPMTTASRRRAQSDASLPDELSDSVRALSIVSSPAPMMLREDGAATNERVVSKRSIRALEGLRRSTKSQRIRGLSNTSRLKQIELFESREVIT